MTRLMGSIIALVALVFGQTVPVAAAEQVDLLLVLASDVSRSVDHPKFLLQREGYAAAISDPQVLDAIRSGPHQKIAVCFVEWSGFGAQKLVIDWTGDRRRRERPQVRRPAVGSAALVRRPHLDQRRHRVRRWRSWRARRSRRRAAPSTSPATAPTMPAATCALARDEAVAKGVTINGLVILSDRPVPWNPEHTNPPGGLEKYYHDNVIGGPGAFVMVAENFDSFGRAIIKKMIAEIAALAAAARASSSAETAVPHSATRLRLDDARAGSRRTIKRCKRRSFDSF